MKIGIIKYGLGNIGSVFQAVKNIGSNPQIIDIPSDLKKVDKVILPGVGNFKRSKTILDNDGWTEEILEACLNLNKPILGICLGMQLLAEFGYEGLCSDEYSKVKGLGLIKGEVVNIKDLGCKEKVPHMGWNTVTWEGNPTLLKGIPNRMDFYFVHSFGFVPKYDSNKIATVDYSIPITSIIHRNNIWGTQFHPEKSSKAGLKIIENFVYDV